MRSPRGSSARCSRRSRSCARKALLRASDAFDGETVTDLAEDLGEWAVDGDWRAGVDLDRRIERASAADVTDAAARLLAPERRVVGWSLPRS